MASSISYDGEERKNLVIRAINLHTAGSIRNYPNFHITENNVAYWLRSILYSLFWVQYGTTEWREGYCCDNFFWKKFEFENFAFPWRHETTTKNADKSF